MAEPHNKGKKYFLCRKCGKKRYFTKVQIPGYNFRFTCSRGHSFVHQGLTAARIAAAFEDIVLPTMKELFNRDDMFYRSIKRG